MRLDQIFPCLGIRWTIGDVSDAGYEALRLSIWSAWNFFGQSARYAVCANTVPLSSTMARTGLLSVGVNWFHTDDLIPIWLIYYLGRDMAEGVAWKLAPLFACFQLCTSYRSITT
jgi:hypothetical protein